MARASASRGRRVADRILVIGVVLIAAAVVVWLIEEAIR